LLRKDLVAETKQTTVPYVYIGGQFIGGEDATKKARDDGTLMDRLKGAGIKFDDTLLQEQKMQKQTTA
jgi:glutaredoxin-related protein